MRERSEMRHPYVYQRMTVEQRLAELESRIDRSDKAPRHYVEVCGRFVRYGDSKRESYVSLEPRRLNWVNPGDSTEGLHPSRMSLFPSCFKDEKPETFALNVIFLRNKEKTFSFDESFLDEIRVNEVSFYRPSFLPDTGTWAEIRVRDISPEVAMKVVSSALGDMKGSQ